MILLINCCLKARLPCRCSDGACHSGFTATVCHIVPYLLHWHSVPYCAIAAPLGTTLLVAAVVSHQETPRLLISYFHIFLLSLAPLVILQSFPSQSSFSEHFNTKLSKSRKNDGMWFWFFLLVLKINKQLTINNLFMTSELVFAERASVLGAILKL